MGYEFWVLCRVYTLLLLPLIRFMEEILHHLECIKPCKQWVKLPIIWLAGVLSSKVRIMIRLHYPWWWGIPGTWTSRSKMRPNVIRYRNVTDHLCVDSLGDDNSMAFRCTTSKKSSPSNSRARLVLLLPAMTVLGMETSERVFWWRFFLNPESMFKCLFSW